MRIAAYIGGLLGLALLVALMIRSDLSAMLHALDSGGLQLLWLVPYRALFFALYAVGWLALLGPYDPKHRAGVGYLFWVTAVREAVDRLLPVASVGGGVVGVRLLRWRGLATVPVSATVIVEMVTTMVTVYLFTGLGLLLLVEFDATGRDYHRLLLAFTLTLPVPVATVLLLRFGSAFGRLQKFLRPMVGESITSEQAQSLDDELRACLRRGRRWLASAALQFVALTSGCFEIWFTLRLFGHPVSWATALVLESMTQAVRHLAFVVPAGLGVQEAGLVIFGHAFGISGELALAVSMAKRIREVLCGLPALMSWQWSESRRIQGLAGNAAQ